MPCCRGTTPTTQREGTLSGTVCVSVRLGDGWGRVCVYRLWRERGRVKVMRGAHMEEECGEGDNGGRCG